MQGTGHRDSDLCTSLSTYPKTQRPFGLSPLIIYQGGYKSYHVGRTQEGKVQERETQPPLHGKDRQKSSPVQSLGKMNLRVYFQYDVRVYKVFLFCTELTKQIQLSGHSLQSKPARRTMTFRGSRPPRQPATPRTNLFPLAYFTDNKLEAPRPG